MFVISRWCSDTYLVFYLFLAENQYISKRVGAKSGTKERRPSQDPWPYATVCCVYQVTTGTGTS